MWSDGVERIAVDLFPAVPASAQGLPAELAIADRAPLLLGEGHPVFDQPRVGGEHIAQLLGALIQAHAWHATAPVVIIVAIVVLPIAGAERSLAVAWRGVSSCQTHAAIGK